MKIFFHSFKALFFFQRLFGYTYLVFIILWACSEMQIFIALIIFYVGFLIIALRFMLIFIIAISSATFIPIIINGLLIPSIYNTQKNNITLTLGWIICRNFLTAPRWLKVWRINKSFSRNQNKIYIKMNPYICSIEYFLIL